MIDNTYTYKVRAKLLLMVVAVMLFAACSDNDAPEIGGETDTLQLVAYNQWRTDVSETATRAITYPSGYLEYNGPNSIGVYAMPIPTEAYPNPVIPTEVRTFSYDTQNNKWNSLVSVKKDETYCIYGYMPVNSNINCSISMLPEKDTYEDGAIMTFNNLPPVLGGDFCVVTGLLQLELDSKGHVIEDGSLAQGNFGYTGKQNGSNYVCLMLDHLYSCVRFKFLVDATYNNLRTIKLREVKLKTQSNVTYPLTVTLRSGQECNISYGAQGSLSSDYATLFTSSTQEGDALSPLDSEAKVIEGYFAPFADVANNLVLECTYNVYGKDKNGDLILTRENCVATNKLPSRFETGLNQRTTITLTVNPTYLYVLSDPDLDNPTIEVK